jgi:hypothetical protein
MATKKTNNWIKVLNSKIQGRGVFAAKNIRKGKRIIEYTGELIHPDEETNRYDDDNMDRHHTFLFEVDDETTIDGNIKGNAAKYINHACDPNCESVNEEGRIFIEAIKAIKKGEELTYDYNYEVEGRLTKKEKEFYLCQCGSPKCRGTILLVKKKKKKKKTVTKR